MFQSKHIITTFFLLVLLGLSFYYFIFFKNKSQKNYHAATISSPQTLLDSSIIKGEKIFKLSCASCHLIFKNLTGPALQGITKKWPDRKKLYEYIRNPWAYELKDERIKKLHKEYKLDHLAFPNLKDKEIDFIVAYIENESKKKQNRAK